MLTSRPRVKLRPCADDESWLCGTVPVPLDRSRPNGRKLKIAFAVFPHTDPGATAKDALFASDGGPGVANVANRGFQQYLLGDLTDQRDLVVIDHRGTGQSGAIDCAGLQQVIGDFTVDPDMVIRKIGRCGRQLGDDADRYGSGDVAMDMEAVRQALGYPKISLYGLSYAGVFLSAYATRFPYNVRALVIDAGTPATDPRHSWTWGMDIPAARGLAVALHCERAPACAESQPQARSALASLASSLREAPVSGTVEISGLGPQNVVVDERALVDLSADLLNQGELAAAAQSFHAGDPLPLLRLAGEAALYQFEPADPAQDSAGNNVAVNCNDQDFVWNRTDSIPVRQRKYQEALVALGADAFAPFSEAAWSDHFLTDYCLRWPAPDRFTPAVAAGATVRSMPVLILSGDLDTDVPTRTTEELLRVFPKATVVPIPGAAHPAAGWSQCARELVHEFVRTRRVSGTCTDPAFVLATTSSFPATAAQAPKATPSRGDASTALDRRVATATVQTVRDGWLRSFRIPGATGAFAGLRGGTGFFDYDSHPDHAVLTLDGARFTRDVAVTGSATLVYDGQRMRFDVTVKGPRSSDGHLTGRCRFGFGAPFSDCRVSGELGGRRLASSVPAN